MSSSESRSTFVQTYNAMKGQMDWQMKPKDYDYYREVARSAYADMLHDYERNRLYYAGLRAAIAKMRSKGKEVHVLDIGTGTGLLSMMAAEIGADSITAVEEFNPIANVAESVIASNGFSDQIKLVRKRSTEVTVGKGKDMERRANILVTEVFDTELIGEGAIGVFNHAHKELLTDDCLVVPCHCTMYAQVVQSDLASKWNSFHCIKNEKFSINPPVNSESGISSALALHDVQLTQLKREWFTPLTDPIPVFKFDFGSSKQSVPINDQVVLSTVAVNSGTCDAIFVWWDAFMDPDHKVLMSCAPIWAHPDKNLTVEDIPWRNHWMQSIYYPSQSIRVNSGESLSLIGDHNEYSLMFDVSAEKPENVSPINNAVPFGGIHLAGISRTRLGQMNHEIRNGKFIRALESIQTKIKESFVLLSMSDLSLLPLMAASSTNVSKIYISKQNKYMETLLQEYIKNNPDLNANKFVFLKQENEDLTLGDIPEKVNCIIGEPYFSSCYLPWHNLFYWFKVHELIKSASYPIHIMPKKMEIWGLPVEYQDLWKIRSPLNEVEGFKMQHFDDVIMKACDVGDADVEPQPLWEYPCIAKSDRAIKLISFDLEKPIESQTSIVSLPARGKINGMALWSNWYLTDDVVDSGGPIDISNVRRGEKIEWDVHSKQGVYFFKNTSTDESDSIKIECSTSFDALEGDVKFSFSLNLTL